MGTQMIVGLGLLTPVAAFFAWVIVRELREWWASSDRLDRVLDVVAPLAFLMALLMALVGVVITLDAAFPAPYPAPAGEAGR